MSKLTLSIDPEVVERVRRYAKRHGISISRIVETYLAGIASPPSRAARETPVLRSLRGSLKRADLDEYKRHLAAKYR